MGLTMTNTVQYQITSQKEQEIAGEISRLFNAAVIDSQFCNLLLTRPDQALTQGYNGEQFRLSSREHQVILTAKSTTLADLAQRYVEAYRL